MQRAVASLTLALLAVSLATAQPGSETAPAPASPDACEVCSAPQNQTLAVTGSFASAADSARFYTAASGGSILVFFDLLVNFTHPVADVSKTAFSVANGAVLVVSSLDNCTQYELKGYARQDHAWQGSSASINISLAKGALQDCQGNAFPAFAISTSVPDKPICSFYTTNMAVSAQGAVLMGSTAAVALVCSQPVFGLTKSLLNVTLTPAASQNEITVGLLPTVIAQATNLTAAPSPAPAPSCVDYNISQVAPVANAQTFYSITIDLEDCFYGQVEVELTDAVYSTSTGASLPMRSITFSKVAQSLVNVTGSSLIKTASMADYVAPVPNY